MPFTLAIQAMGTRFELVLPGLDPGLERAAGEVALEVVLEWDERLSPFRRDSLLSFVNREAGARAVRVDPRTFDLLAACAQIHKDSQGAFDAGLGARMRARGFRGEPAGDARAATAGFEAVRLDPSSCSVRFEHPAVQLDLGAVAKGHALDAAAQVLRESGVSCALIHGGTSVIVALGAPPELDAWRVGLHSGSAGPRAHLCDQALAVSAQHGRTNAAGEGHVLDPRSGGSVASGDVAAVVAPLGLAADAWSTALLVLGELPERAARAGVAGLIGARGRWRTSGAPGPFELPAGDDAGDVR